MARTKNNADTVTSTRIRELRKSNNLTQAELAEKIGVTDQTIRKYESGRYGIPTTSIYSMASALGCCPEYLLDETDCVTQEEYDKLREDVKEIDKIYRAYYEAKARKEKIVEDALREFLGYTVKKKELSILPVAGDREIKCKTTFTLTTPEGKQVKFDSTQEWEHFVLSFFDDAKKVLKFHIYEYENRQVADEV